MKAFKLSFLSVLMLIYSLPIVAQVQISKEDSIKIEEKINRDLEELFRRSSSEKRIANLKSRSDYLDSLIVQDSMNFWALNQKISLQIVTFDHDSAEMTLEKFHQRTLHTSKYDFIKATLFEHFGHYELANKLYKSEINQLNELFKKSTSGYEKSESLLGLWYVNRYLGNESKADSLISMVRSEYYRYMNVGVDWNFFNNRFGDGIFEVLRER